MGGFLKSDHKGMETDFEMRGPFTRTDPDGSWPGRCVQGGDVRYQGQAVLRLHVHERRFDDSHRSKLLLYRWYLLLGRRRDARVFATIHRWTIVSNLRRHAVADFVERRSDDSRRLGVFYRRRVLQRKLLGRGR